VGNENGGNKSSDGGKLNLYGSMGNCICLHALDNCEGLYSTGESDLSVRAWQATSEQLALHNADFFPESKYLQNKSDVAICFGGGGARAYLCAIGCLAGLREIGLLEKIKYIGGLGGSSWAIIAFTYSQLQEDAKLLGEIVSPEDLTLKKLNEMDPSCMRGFCSKNLVKVVTDKKSAGCELCEVWTDVIYETYLRPVGIKKHRYFSFNKETVADIKLRNPCLASQHFYLPTTTGRPFPIVGITVVGPDILMPEAPFVDVSSQNFNFIEVTPLYVGNFHTHSIEYDKKLNVITGGVIEPFGFARTLRAYETPEKGLGNDQTEGLLFVPRPLQILDLEQIIAVSSYDPEMLFTQDFIMKDEGAFYFDYWSCVPEKPIVLPTILADGSYSQNLPLISFLQRRVKKIVLFFESSTSLSPSDEWNPDEEFTPNHVDYALSSYFGIFPAISLEVHEVVYGKNQVFPKEEFSKVVRGLQAAQKNGGPILFTTELLTVENQWWGIPAGVKSEVTFSYLGRIPAWEEKLPSETKKQLEKRGELAEFPHYKNPFKGVNSKNANLLCNMVGWSITQQKETFQNILC